MCLLFHTHPAGHTHPGHTLSTGFARWSNLPGHGGVSESRRRVGFVPSSEMAAIPGLPGEEEQMVFGELSTKHIGICGHIWAFVGWRLSTLTSSNSLDLGSHVRLCWSGREHHAKHTIVLSM